MGVELIFLTVGFALVPLLYGFRAFCGICVYLNSEKKIRGRPARLIGIGSMLLAVVYFVYVVTIWGLYGWE